MFESMGKVDDAESIQFWLLPSPHKLEANALTVFAN